MQVFGRRDERLALDGILADARAGRSGAVIARGEAGIGKTTLLEYARAAAEALEFRIERAIGMESERQFAYAALYQLCSPLMTRASALAEPQRDALALAFGGRAGAAPDRFLVGLAVLNLLAETAEERPLLCLIDDAQWLDRESAEVIAFVARRIAAERLAFVIAGREPDEREAAVFSGIPIMSITGLADRDARALLETEIRTPIDDGVRDRLIAEAFGNPLALLELPRGADPVTLASGLGVDDRPTVAGRLEETFLQRSTALPAETRRLLLVASAEPGGDVALLLRALSALGIEPSAASPAETAGLLTIDSAVRFRHPLVRSAIYGAASPSERRQAHHALAAAIDSRTDPDRRAWHRGQAALEADEEIADELWRAGDAALARGGMAAAAAFMQRAAELTPEPSLRTRRAMEAAQATYEAGAANDALALLALAERGPLDPLQSARLLLFRAHITFYLAHGEEIPVQFLDAARALAPLDPAMSRETFLLALNAATVMDACDRDDVRSVAEAALAAPLPPEPTRPLDLLLDGLATTYTRGYTEGAGSLQRALAAFRDEGHLREVGDEAASDRWLWLAFRAAVALFDDDGMHGLALRNVAITRKAGALATLRTALIARSVALVLSGDLARAATFAAESTAIARATGGAELPYGALLLASWQGDASSTMELARGSIRSAGSGRGAQVTVAHYALAVLHTASGDVGSALAAAQRAAESNEISVVSLALPELIEAAARAGSLDVARAAYVQLAGRARASGTPWASGMAARSRALITPGDDAEPHYREAIALLAGTRLVGHHARARLLYGEWLRRAGRRRDAREELRSAHELLTGMGALGFADRAARELRATGERPRMRTASPSAALTDHELHIARLVATGATSREVATTLYLSPRTIEAHLRSIFRKLGITSRRQLKELAL